jgi:hypothetical protein
MQDFWGTWQLQAPDAHTGSVRHRGSAADIDQGQTLEVNTIVKLATAGIRICDSHFFEVLFEPFKQLSSRYAKPAF